MTTQPDHDLDAEPGDDADIDQLQADIERNREQLGETVAALSHKLDVKAQAGERVAHARGWAADQVDRGLQATTDSTGKTLPAIRFGVPATLGAVAVAVGLLVWRRSR